MAGESACRATELPAAPPRGQRAGCGSTGRHRADAVAGANGPGPSASAVAHVVTAGGLV